MGGEEEGRAARPVPYDELLEFASKISKFSQPPSLTQFQRMMAQIGFGVPPVGEGVKKNDSEEEGTGAAEAKDTEEKQEAKLGLGLTEEDMAMLDPSTSMVFKPWPSEEQMKMGALRAVGDGALVEDMLPLEHQEQLKQEREERERAAAANGAGGDEKVTESGGEKRVSYVNVPQQRKTQAPVKMTLDLFIPDED